MRIVALALISSMAFPLSGNAQSLNMFDHVAFDAGIGASYGPAYPGASDKDGSPWFILRNLTLGEGGDEKQGFALLPSFG